MTDENSPKRSSRPIPFEGDDGLFRQSWYAVCRSQDLEKKSVRGVNFLDGRVVAIRDATGRAKVFSAYCPHVGADLSLGAVTERGLQCAFHRWEFNGDGKCVKTGMGDPAPPNATLFSFPTTEAFGVVWAFNGTKPLFDLPLASRPMSELMFDVAEPRRLATDPWVICSNTPDWSHFSMVHRFGFDPDGQNESIIFEPFGIRRRFTAHLERGEGPSIAFEVTVRGTTLVLIEGIIGGSWFAVAACLGIPEKGKCEFFVTTMIDSNEVPAAQASDMLQSYVAIGNRMFAEDAPIWNTIRFRPGSLTKSDTALAHYLEELRRYPRAHPSADFIR